MFIVTFMKSDKSMSSWIENIKNQHGTLEEEDEEEDEQQTVPQNTQVTAKPQEKPQQQTNQSINKDNATNANEKVENQTQSEQNAEQKETEQVTEKQKYNGPNTPETVLFAKSFDKLSDLEERNYVRLLLDIRASLSSVLDGTSKPLETASILNKTSSASKQKYQNLRKAILKLPVPHQVATQK